MSRLLLLVLSVVLHSTVAQDNAAPPKQPPPETGPRGDHQLLSSEERASLLQESKNIVVEFLTKLKKSPPSKWREVGSAVSRDGEGNLRGKIFRPEEWRDTVEKYLAQFVIDAPVGRVVDVLWTHGDRLPLYPGSTLADGRTLLWLDNTTKISYALTKEQSNGLLAQRDFVELNRLEAHKNGAYTMAYASIHYPGQPEVPGIVRARSYVSGFRISPNKKNRARTDVIFLTDSNLKFFLIPRVVLRRVLPISIKEYMELVKDASEGLRVPASGSPHAPGPPAQSKAPQKKKQLHRVREKTTQAR